MVKFKVGDKVIFTRGNYEYIEKGAIGTLDIVDNNDNTVFAYWNKARVNSMGNKSWWADFKYIELVKEKNEFTFEEVIARIKEGETYEHKEGFIIKNNGIIEVVCHNLISSPPITTEAVKIRFTNKHHFKLVEPKKTYLLYDVEHQEGGKRFAFRCDGVPLKGDLVLCNTIKGKSYGKIVGVREIKLTQKEYMAYKEIIKDFNSLLF